MLTGFVAQPTPPASAATTSTISGHAFEDIDRDGWRDAGEPTFANHGIYLLTAGGGAWIASSTTDAQGRYSFGGLTPGTYRVEYQSGTWNSMREDWFPTTAPIASPPSLEVVVGGALQVDWGFRRIIRSVDVAQPISEYVGSSGLRVQSYVDVVSAAAVYDVLATGLLGPEAAHTTVRFGLPSTNMTTTSFASSGGRYISFSAISYANYLSWAAGGGSWRTVSHEYGHAWSYYHAMMTQQTGTFDSYLVARGLAGDPRIGSTGAWTASEMIAEDYRQLLGPVVARSAPQVNRDIPLAGDVAGLREFLELEFTTPPGGDVTAPTAQLISPGAASTVSGLVAVVVGASDGQTAVESLTVFVVVDGGQRLAASFDPVDRRFHVVVDSTSLIDGTHTLAAQATDTAGNTATSSAVTVNVVNTQKGPRKGGGRPTKP
ncbi:MAG TPA: SdrD B-like domain-containing protein [Acidimicrobiales bacterium]